MALTYQESLLVKTTIPALRERGETITSMFYENMLRDHSELHDYFNRVNLVNGRQPRALCAVILNFASNINHIAELIPRFEKMCHKHCSLGIKPEHYEIVGHYLLQAFADVLGPAMTSAVMKAWTKAYYVLARMLCTRESQIYSSFGKWDGPRKFRIDRKVKEADDMWSFYLAPDNGKPIPSFLPGQYVTVHFPVLEMGHSQKRQYSLSDAPRSSHYRITVRRNEGACHSNSVSTCYLNPGVVSNLLIDSCEVGDKVNLSHPAGEFFMDTSSFSRVPLVLISSGIGVAPLIAMANAALESQPSRPLSWIQQPERAPTIAFQEHMEKMKQKCQNLRLTYLPPGQPATGDDDLESAFPILAAVTERDLMLDQAGTEYFVCGHEKFVVEVTRDLQSRGVPQSRLLTETFTIGDSLPRTPSVNTTCPMFQLR